MKERRQDKIKKRNDEKNWHLNLIQSRGVGFDIVTRLMRTPVEH